MAKWLSRVTDLGCVICGGVAVVHHVKPSKRRPGDDTSVRRDDRYVVPLCPRHHNIGGWGVALHDGERTWETRYGTQAEWLDVVDRRLEVGDA